MVEELNVQQEAKVNGAQGAPVAASETKTIKKFVPKLRPTLAGGTTGFAPGIKPAGIAGIKTMSTLKPALKPVVSANTAPAVQAESVEETGLQDLLTEELSEPLTESVQAGKLSTAIKRPDGKKSFLGGGKIKKAVPAAESVSVGESLLEGLPPMKPRCWWGAVLLFWTLAMTVISIGILYLSLLEKNVMAGIRGQVTKIAANVVEIKVGPEAGMKLTEEVQTALNAAEKENAEIKTVVGELKALL